MKKTISAIAALLISVIALAQSLTGGVKGKVVDRQGRAPIEGATVSVFLNDGSILLSKTNAKGSFLIGEMADGIYRMSVMADGFNETFVNVTVDGGFVKDMHFITMTSSRTVNEATDESFTEFDMNDSGFTDNPTILFGANDVYNSIAGYGFSAIRFKNRGYDSESQEVYLSGVKLNDAITGYSPYSLWSGLNEATRSKESTIGMETGESGIGHYNGITNIFANPASMRKGWRFSALTNSSLYRIRLMGSYASGELDNGWSYGFNASVRAGGNDWIKGVFYRNFAFYGGVEKNWDGKHRLSLSVMVAPGRRGTQNASTQEVYDLMGDNMYNSNWGYQNGKVRNSRIRKTIEPVTVLKYTATPSDRVSASLTFLWRTGKNGYTALDWYDAADPRPDYYRNLPSYAYMEDADYNRSNTDKYEWAYEMWSQHTDAYNKYQHVDWDRMYNVNRNSPDGRSRYVQEERHVDQNDLHLAASVKWDATERFTLNAGMDGRWNRTENYKLMADLLGGEYFLNVDNFAERDFASNEAKIQNDLDYFLQHGQAEKIGNSNKYGYDYLADVRRAGVWANAEFKAGRFSVSAGGRIGCESFWRTGLYRKGLFAGLDDNGNEISYGGEVLTRYDSDGKVISSKGESEHCNFITWAAKASLSYVFSGRNRISANVGWFNDAPTFAQSFISPRTRNTITPGLTTSKAFSADINYQYSHNGLEMRLTGFYTAIRDLTKVMNFYDDSQNSFTNFAMGGINQRNMGIEFGMKVPVPAIKGLSLSAVASWGEYIYTSKPVMTQTIDNSTEVIIDKGSVKYWDEHPVFAKKIDATGKEIYDTDEEGNYIIERRQKHYVPSTPQLALEAAVNYRLQSYWFFELNGQYFCHSYLDMNPLYRTGIACSGPDGVESPAEIEYMAAQEEFPAAFLLNASVGKSWYINRKYNFGFSLELKNILNNRNVKTGGYEQARLIKSSGSDRYYRFDPKYFHMAGFNYMLNIYFRF